jgi:hypothetical protein
MEACNNLDMRGIAYHLRYDQIVLRLVNLHGFLRRVYGLGRGNVEPMGLAASLWHAERSLGVPGDISGLV